MSRRYPLAVMALLMAALLGTYPAGAWAQEDPRMSMELDRLLKTAEEQNKLDELAAQARKAIEDRPNWIAGRVALVLIELRRDKLDEAKAALEDLLADKDRRIPQVTAMTAGPKLERVAALRPLAIRFYEQSLNPEEELQYVTSPARRLVALYREENRKEDARRLLVKYADRQLAKRMTAADLAGIQAQDRMEIARQLEDLGCPLDALLLYRRMLEAPAGRAGAAHVQPNFGVVVRKEIARLEASLPPESILAMLPDAAKIAEGKSAGPAVDFMIQIDRDESGEANLTSPMATALKATAGKPELRQQASDRLAPLTKARPEDLSAAVATALLELASGTAEQQAQAVGRVVELVDKRPLAPADDPTKLTDDQRADAVEQFSVVLVAMACQGNQPLKAQAEKLAGRALDAAWRHPKKELVSVVLARLGPQALAQSDPEAVRQRLQQILQSLLTPPGSSSKPAGAAPVAPEAFDQVADLAQCAANAGLADLSLDCMRQALQAGPPMEAGPAAGPYQAPRARGGAQAAISPEVSAKIEQTLARLNRGWTEQKVPAVKVYETLVAVVLPESKPDAVWLYANRSTGGFEKWRSVGDLLAERAVEAGKAEDLKSRLSTRKPNPQGELDCQVLQLQLALASDDAASANDILKKLADRMQRKWTMDTARQLTPAAISALRHSATRPVAETLVKQISSMLTGGSAWGERLIEKTAVEDAPKK